jgi:hypothetical protein
MRKALPTAILSFVATIILVDYWFKVPVINNTAKDITTWVSLIANVALGLGAVNLLLVHSRHIRLKRQEWGNSAVLIALMLFVAVVGIARSSNSPTYRWLYDNINVPIGSTLFATAAFQIASASYRTFRARNVEAALLLLTGIFVMLGKVPLGEMMASWMPTFAQWILDVWNTAAQRGIMMCTAIGLIIISVRVITGMERGHFGSGE